MSAERAEATIHASLARPRAPRYALPVVLGAVLVGALLGAATATFATGHTSATGARRSPSAAEPFEAMSLDRWLAAAAAMASDRGAPDPALREHAVRSLVVSPGLRRQVLARYGREQDRHVRGVMRELVVAAGSDELDAAARALAESDDRGQRAAGFELLASMPASDATYALARQRVFDETDADALAGALAAFVPVARRSNEEANVMLPRLIELARHAEPLVRAHAVQRIAEWDVGRAAAVPIVHGALGDRDRVVRQAAVGAIMIAWLHDDNLKPGLLELAARRDEELVTRGAALQALERFPLTDDEQAAYVAARADVERVAGQR